MERGSTGLGGEGGGFGGEGRRGSGGGRGVGGGGGGEGDFLGFLLSGFLLLERGAALAALALVEALAACADADDGVAVLGVLGQQTEVAARVTEDVAAETAAETDRERERG